MNVEHIENRSLIIGVFINLIMAIGGWITYDLTNSEAILLDGNFSFIAAISTLLAVIITNKKHNRSDKFPFGRYAYESFFIFFKGISILGITIAAISQNVIKIIDYLNGKKIKQLDTEFILYYIILMIVLCFGLGIYYYRRNKIVKFKSSILNVESKSAIIDGFLSLGVGVALVSLSLISHGSFFDFILYIGDAIIVVVLGLGLLKIPIQIIKDAFIELAGGVLQDKNLKDEIEKTILNNLLPEFNRSSNYITKLGSNYFIVIYLIVTDEKINITQIEKLRENIYNSLIKTLHSLNVEIILRKKD